jgi:VanZ family protein
MKKLIKLWLPVFIWAGAIYLLSATPNLAVSSGWTDFVLRKLAHAAEYFIFTFLLYRAFQGTFRLSFIYLVISPAAIAFLYAVSDELHQYFVPTRVCSWKDVLIDAVGIAFFYVIIRFKKVSFPRAE